MLIGVALLLPVLVWAYQDIQYCSQYQLVPDYYNPSEYMQICIECQQNYVLSFNQKECFYFQQSDFDYYYCKRMGRGQFCEEGLCSIQLNENGQYLSVLYGHPDENCAIVDSKTGDCMYPRFNYNLNLITKKISKDTKTFCAVRNDEECLEYFSLFIPQDSNQSLFLSNFVNPEYISNAKSLNKSVICKDDYELVIQEGSSDKFYGCMIKNYQVQNCQEYDVYKRICIKCNEGFSLNINGKECKLVENCSKHQDEKYCKKCNQFYHQNQGYCQKIENCKKQEIDENQYCAYCDYPYYGEWCQYINNNITDGCELLNRWGQCVKCKNNELNFFNKQTQQCQPRILSKKCKELNPTSDYCLNFECQEEYKINIEFLSKYHQLYFGFSETYSCKLLQSNYSPTMNGNWADSLYFDTPTKVLYDQYYRVMYGYTYQVQTEQYCIERSQTIEGCLEYDLCYESCSVCKDGYKLRQRNDILLQFYYRFICVEDIPTKIQNCLLQKDFSEECQQCENYYTNSQNICQLGTVNNCLQYGYNNQCSICEKNYVLYNNQCFYVELCSEYLLQYNNVYCTKCIQKPGLFISLVKSSNNLRSDCIQNLPTNPCSSIIDDVCIQCSQEYVLIEGTNTCVKESEVGDYCFKANSSFECLSCISGYRLVKGKCFKISGSCTLRYSCTSTQCDINCLGVNNTCQYSCDSNQFTISGQCQNCSNYYNQHCQKCNHSRCLKCDEGFYSKYNTGDSGQCLYLCENGSYSYNPEQCPCMDPNCRECSQSDKSQCLYCHYNKYLQDYKCGDSCSEGYLQQHYNYYDNFYYCYKCQDNCEQCYFNFSSPKNCSKCKPGWFLDNGDCVEKCSKFTEYGICTDKCFGFYLNGECVNNCPYFYYTDPTKSEGEGNHICVEKCPENLFEYESVYKTCDTTCQYGYFQDDSQKKCLKCKTNDCDQCIQNLEICEKCNSNYFLVEGKCKYICPNQIIVNNVADCTKCNMYCQSCDSSNLQCNKCLDNMEIDAYGNCNCDWNKGYTLSYPNKCLKCELENCDKCWHDGINFYCQQCKSGFSLRYDTQQCVEQCPVGYFSSNGYCTACTSNCLECTQNGCSKCVEGFSPYSVWNNNSQCLYQCPNGNKSYDPSQCECYVSNCILCNYSPFECQQCNPDYLNYGNKCELNSNECGGNCLQCDGAAKYCMVCIAGSYNVSGICYYKCNNGDLVRDQAKCNSSVLCQVSNCSQCDPSNPNACQICDPSYHLINSQCSTTCPDGFYLDISKVCQPCNPLCQTCSSSDKCDSCKNTSSASNDCLCPVGQKLYKKQCLQKCPFHSTQIGEDFCIEDCADALYPVYTANKEQRLCQKVEDANSPYCLQNIENIPALLLFQLQDFKQTDNSYYIIITIQQTPSLCYSFLMKGLNDNQFDTQLIKEDIENTIYQVTIAKSAIEKKLLECTDFKCLVYLNISYLEELQYIVLLTLDFDVQIILTNGVNFSGSVSTIIGVCPTCVIPSSLIIPSKVSVQCSDNQNCSSESISTSTNSKITIIQTIDDPRFSNNKLTPHSLKIEHTLSNGVKNTLYITNYFFDNSILGQIKYTFQAISLKSGTLTLTSVCKSAIKANGRVLSSVSSDNVVYPQMSLALQIEDEKQLSSSSVDQNGTKEKDSDDESYFPLLFYILLGVFSIVLILVIVFIAYKCHAKRKAVRLVAEKYKESSNVEKANDDESQNKQLNNDKSLNVDLSLQQQTFDLKN